ncbi:MAG: PQQ-binding-like beta-propeller repeat protein [Armatimonadota bacterium]
MGSAHRSGVVAHPRAATLALTAAVLLTAAPARAQWPMFRRDAARTGVATEASVSALEVAWSAQLGGSVDGSPAVVGGLVYVGNSLGTMHAISSDNGSPRWRVDTEGAVVSSPAVAEGLAVFGSVDGFLYAVNSRDGHLRWRYRTRGPILSSPAIVQGRVLFGSMDGRLYALALEDGSLLWRSERGAGIQGSPAVGGDTVCYGDDAGRMCALSLADGSPRWELVLRPESEARMSWRAESVDPAAAIAERVPADTAVLPKVVAAPVISGDLVVFGLMGPSALRPPRLEYLIGVDLATGQKRWALSEAYSVLGAPLIADGFCYFITVEGYVSKTVARALRLSDRQLVWEQQVGNVVDSSAALLGTNLCFGCHDGNLYLLAAETGELIDRERLAPKVYSSPAFSDGRIYVGASDGRLYCLQPPL